MRSSRSRRAKGRYYHDRPVIAAVSGAIVGNYLLPRDEAPFLPWPPPAPTSMGEIGAGLKLSGTYGAIDAQLRRQLAFRGYEKLRYFAVPQGFAITTEVERLNEAGGPHAARWLRGKRGGFRGFVDYFRTLLIGEEGRFRLLALIVTSEDLQPAPFVATQTDVDRWEQTGRISLSPQRSAAAVLPGTRAWLLVYEFQASKSKSAELVALRNGFPFSVHRRFVGFR